MFRFLLIASLVACGSKPSLLDDKGESGAAPLAAKDDPWATPPADPAPAPTMSPPSGGGLGGFDLPTMLSKITDGMKKPGVYEAPEKSTDFDANAQHLGVLELGGNIVERSSYSFGIPVLGGGGARGIELRRLVERIRELSKDSMLAGLVLRVRKLDISLPDVIELRMAFQEFRAAGKSLRCHTEGASNATYLVLAACERIGIAPIGQIAITGPAAMPIHVKGLLDKLGVQADFLHVGAYKGAAEPLTREAPSKEMDETLDAILARHYQTMVDVIGASRGLEAATVKGLIDTGLYSSNQAKDAKLVDEVGSFEAFRDAAKQPWTTIELEPSLAGDRIASMFKLMRFVGAAPPDRPAGDHVAVVYALGNIVDGGGDGVLGARQEIASHTLVAALRALTIDDRVKAVVLRIDSGGGSAQASELIHRAVADLKAKKPVIVSMSDVAASGGYYIAANATRIYALDNTLTGSIGVVGGKIAPGKALANVGVATFPRGKGRNATIMASFQPWTDGEKQIIQKSMEEVYDVFTKRVAEGRKLDLAKVKELAQGRVWTGAKAKELGLVDEIGGLDAAIAKARELGKVESTELEIYPPSPTLRDFLQSFGGGNARVSVGATEMAAIEALHPALADAALRLVDLVMSFRTTHVQAISILPVVR